VKRRTGGRTEKQRNREIDTRTDGQTDGHKLEDWRTHFRLDTGQTVWWIDGLADPCYKCFFCHQKEKRVKYIYFPSKLFEKLYLFITLYR
jgi:hypothetical protein